MCPPLQQTPVPSVTDVCTPPLCEGRGTIHKHQNTGTKMRKEMAQREVLQREWEQAAHQHMRLSVCMGVEEQK